MEPRPLAPQLAVLGLAAVIAALLSASSLASLVLAYALAWLTINAQLARGVGLPKLSRCALAISALLVLATPLTVLAARLAAAADGESLVGLDENVRDRLRLERAIAIHPLLVVSDRPQLFFVTAPAASQVRVTLAPGIRPIDAVALGHDLFRVDYDPRAHGVSRLRGAVEAQLDIDGSRSTRAMHAVHAAAHPRWLHASPDGSRACLTSEETDETLLIDAHGETTRIASSDGPSDCAWTSHRTLAIAHRYSRSLDLASTDGRIVARIALGGGQRQLAASADGALLAVALETMHGEIAIVDVARRRELARVSTGGLADGLAFGGDGRSLIVARHAPAALLRLAFDGATLRVVGERPLLAPATAFSSVEHGARIVIAATDWRDDAAPHLGNHYVQDQLLTFDAATLALVAQLPTARRSPRQDAAGGVDRGLSPISISETPVGSWLVAFAGSDELSRVDPGGGDWRSFDVTRAGLSAPHSVVALLDESADTVLIASSPSSGRVVLLDATTGAVRHEISLAPDDATLLRDDPEALRVRFGERAFYEGTRAGISCHSCHPHGGSDDMAHNIGGRTLAPTLALFGIAGTSPYLRDGSYPRIGDLLEVAEHRYRGYREPAGDRRATVDAYVSALPLPRSLTPRDLPRERRGLAVFAKAGCPTCHAGPAMTNLGRHVVRSVFPRARVAPGASVDTPSLRAVSRRTRWLQDGRASSLRAIFSEHNPDDRHGHTRRLTRAELDDLVVFLESL